LSVSVHSCLGKAPNTDVSFLFSTTSIDKERRQTARPSTRQRCRSSDRCGHRRVRRQYPLGVNSRPKSRREHTRICSYSKPLLEPSPGDLLDLLGPISVACTTPRKAIGQHVCRNVLLASQLAPNLLPHTLVDLRTAAVESYETCNSQLVFSEGLAGSEKGAVAKAVASSHPMIPITQDMASILNIFRSQIGKLEPQPTGRGVDMNLMDLTPLTFLILLRISLRTAFGPRAMKTSMH
jgi:hypothetical protein